MNYFVCWASKNNGTWDYCGPMPQEAAESRAYRMRTQYPNLQIDALSGLEKARWERWRR